MRSLPVQPQSRLDLYRRRLEGLWFSLPGARIVTELLRRSESNHAADMAASIAYFSFFSLFPLLVGAIAILSRFLETDEALAQLQHFGTEIWPGSAEFVRSNVVALIELRGPLGVFSVVALIWSASRVFGALTRAFNRALGLQDPHPAVLARLRHFVLMLIVCGLLLATAAASAALHLADRFTLTQHWFFSGAISSLAGHLYSYALVFFVMALLFWLVPHERAAWSDLWPGAAVGAALFELGKGGLLVYLDAVPSLELLYGSLTSVVVLLLWLYVSARSLLLGMEVVALRHSRRHAAAP